MLGLQCNLWPGILSSLPDLALCTAKTFLLCECICLLKGECSVQNFCGDLPGVFFSLPKQKQRGWSQTTSLCKRLRHISAGICCREKCFSLLLGNILTFCVGLLTPCDCQMPLNIHPNTSLSFCHRKISDRSWGLLGNLVATSGQCGNYSLSTFRVTGTV